MCFSGERHKSKTKGPTVGRSHKDVSATFGGAKF